MEPKLTWEIVDITPDYRHARKIIHADWNWEHDDGRTHVLNDRFHVKPDATDEEIVREIERRRRDVEQQHPYIRPDVSVNSGLIGRVSE